MKTILLVGTSIYVLLLINTIITLMIFLVSLHAPEKIPSMSDILCFPSAAIFASIILFVVGMVNRE